MDCQFIIKIIVKLKPRNKESGGGGGVYFFNLQVYVPLLSLISLSRGGIFRVLKSGSACSCIFI